MCSVEGSFVKSLASVGEPGQALQGVFSSITKERSANAFIHSKLMPQSGLRRSLDYLDVS